MTEPDAVIAMGYSRQVPDAVAAMGYTPAPAPATGANTPHDFNRCRCDQIGRCLVHCRTCDCVPLANAYERGHAAGVAAERQRIRPLLAALHRLYLTVWEETATVDIGYGGYNGLSYDDSNLIDAAGEAVEKLLATGAFADLLDGGGQDGDGDVV